MNLIIDIGNTSTKIAIFNGNEKVEAFRTNQLRCEQIEKKLSRYKIKKAIISSVRIVPPFIFDLLSVNIPFVHMLTHKSDLPFTIGYETPETLGTDRIAGIAGAYKHFPGANVLVIDAGTAITYDFLYGSVYEGGDISPGIEIRFRALNRFTGKLPHLKLNENFRSPGKSTAEAITAGVINGVVYEINEYIRTFEKSPGTPEVILSGGDSGFLKDKISHSFSYIPEIVTDGLNYILEYNAK
jgi:type III pantothenate kinase